jgi:hypothetical protein
VITVSCRHIRPVRSGMVSLAEEPLWPPGQETSKPAGQDLADGPTSEPGPVAPS